MKATVTKRAGSQLEETFALQVRAAKLPKPARQHPIVSGRKFRADFAWLPERLVVEIQGGTWVNGGHNRGSAMPKEYERMNLAQLSGWIVLQFTGDDVKSGKALELTKQALS